MSKIDKSDAPEGYIAVAASRNHHCEECDMFYTYLTYSKKCDARHREDKKDLVFNVDTLCVDGWKKED